MKKKKFLFSFEGLVRPQWLAILLHYLFGWITGSTQMNRKLKALRGHKGAHAMRQFADAVGLTIESKGTENIPKDGAFTAIGNHPGGCDVVAFALTFIESRPDIRIIVSPEITEISEVEDNLLSATAPRDIVRAYQDNVPILMNPQGKSGRKINGNIVETEWSAAFAKNAQRYKNPLVFFYVTGANHDWWYRIANIRQRLFPGSTNIERYLNLWNFVNPPVKDMTIRIAPSVACDFYIPMVEDMGTKAFAEMCRQYAVETKCLIPFEKYYKTKKLKKGKH